MRSQTAVEVSPPRDATTQLSFSGTPRLADGTTRPDDYVPELLDPVSRMMVFEEMRASDDAVNTAIDARRQEINAANWLLSTEDTGPQATEILQFCEDNLYPVLDQLLRLLGGGGLQYGFGAVEPVFRWSDEPPASTVAREDIARPAAKFSGRRIVLQKLAHLRQRTVHTFKITETGELTAVEQYVFNGSAFLRRLVPADKLLIWTYDQQGDDCWGVPPTRHCYRAWTFKQQIERLNLQGLDRFGVGTPVIEAGEGWTDLERKQAFAGAKAWRAGENAALMYPFGGKISLMAGDGTMMASALAWVQFYNLAIAKTFLTQQTELGSTQTGARALGETFLQQMGGLVQADCEDLASLINDRLVRRLVDWNFGRQDVYPAFAPSERVTYGGGVGQVLQQLIASGAIHPRPEDEAFLRDALNLPAVEVEVLQQEADTRVTQAADLATKAAAAAADPTPAGGGASGSQGPPSPAPGTAAQDAPSAPAGPRRVAARLLALAPGAPDPATPGLTYRTPDYQTWEQGVLRPDVLMRDLDLSTARLAGEVQDVLAAIDDDLERQAAELADQGPAALSAGVRDLAVPARLRTKLRRVLMEAANRSRDYGAKSVRNEIARQIGPDGIGPSRDGWLPPTMSPPSLFARFAARIRALVAGSDDPGPRDLHLAAEVDRAVEEEVARRESAARSAITSALSQAGADLAALGVIVGSAIKAALIGLSTGRTQANVQGVVNVGFGVGRSDAAEALAPETAADGTTVDNPSGLVDADGNAVALVAKVYSAVMDGGTCDECAKWDGAQFPIDYPEDYSGVQAPNPRCSGGYGRCRCVWIYITDAESTPLVPRSKGPVPFSREDLDAAIRELTATTQRQLGEKLEALAARMTPATAPQPIALTVHVDATKGPVTKTIAAPNGQTFTVTEDPA